jgi:mRNA interferase MazF
MYKDYLLWGRVKSKVNNKNYSFFGIKEREIWICNLGENIGFEEDGKGNNFTRPVLVLRVFNRRFCYVVPLSTTKKRGKYFYPFDGRTGKISVALLSQLKAIDVSRLRRKIGFVSKVDFEEILKRLFRILEDDFP